MATRRLAGRWTSCTTILDELAAPRVWLSLASLHDP